MTTLSASETIALYTSILDNLKVIALDIIKSEDIILTIVKSGDKETPTRNYMVVREANMSRYTVEMKRFMTIVLNSVMLDHVGSTAAIEEQILLVKSSGARSTAKFNALILDILKKKSAK